MNISDASALKEIKHHKDKETPNLKRVSAKGYIRGIGRRNNLTNKAFAHTSLANAKGYAQIIL